MWLLCISSVALIHFLFDCRICPFCAAEKAVEQLRVAAQKNAIVQPLELDVADPDSITAAVKRLREQRNQKIGVVVNRPSYAAFLATS